MNIKRISSKEARMQAYAERQRRRAMRKHNTVSTTDRKRKRRSSRRGMQFLRSLFYLE